jgi:transposase-like protein
MKQCKKCESEEIVKNGKIHTGKQRYRCKKCGYQFTDSEKRWNAVSEQTIKIIDRMLLERISMRGIKRVVGVSWDWLQTHVNKKIKGNDRGVF